jgi:hypothetical protein
MKPFKVVLPHRKENYGKFRRVLFQPNSSLEVIVENHLMPLLSSVVDATASVVEFSDEPQAINPRTTSIPRHKFFIIVYVVP